MSNTLLFFIGVITGWIGALGGIWFAFKNIKKLK